MKKYLISTLLLFVINIVFAQGKLYLFQVIESSAISTGAIKDGENIRNIAQDVCQSSGHQFALVSMNSSNATKFYVERKLNEYSFTVDDVIWFYYSGHGDNFDTWPRTDETELTLTDVYSMLSNTAAGLSLSMFDCCCWRDPIVTPKKEYMTCSSKYYKYLFKYSKGHIKIASCSSKEFSFGSENTGSFFSNTFIDALKSESSWTSILENAKSNTQQLANGFSKIQNPQFDFSFGFIDVGKKIK